MSAAVAHFIPVTVAVTHGEVNSTSVNFYIQQAAVSKLHKTGGVSTNLLLQYNGHTRGL